MSSAPGPPAADATALAEHFAFGANWRRFLERVDESRIAAAEASLRRLLALDQTPRPLAGRRFLDAGCGSGLFSLAASRLGGVVVGFDFDPQSVACTRELQRRFGGDWPVKEGSVLDADFLASLGVFDIVYSWGVLHHTGAMWQAVSRVSGCVASGGDFALALYNDQGPLSERWRAIKQGYQRVPRLARTPYVAAIGAGYFGWRAARKLLGRAGERPLAAALAADDARGMSRWHDLVDWVGGWPFEVATPEVVVERLGQLGFESRLVFDVGDRHGCNEFLFRKVAEQPGGTVPDAQAIGSQATAPEASP